MVLAGCSGFTVAGVCYSCNMRGMNFYGSLEDYKKSIGMLSSKESSPPPSYPEGFTPGASVPKTPQKVRPNYRKLNEDAGNVRRMQDKLDSYEDTIQYTIANNFPVMRSVLEDKADKTIQNINRARKNVGKGPNKSKKK